MTTPSEKKQETIRPVPKGNLLHMVATDPFLDWIMILAISLGVACILVGTAVSVYLDSRGRIDAPPLSPGHVPALPLDQALLGKVLDAFDAREADRAAALRRWEFPADPSVQQ